MLRTTRLTLDGYDSKDPGKDMWTTTASASFGHPHSRSGGSLPHMHKNLTTSRPFGLDGGLAGAGHFATTNSIAYDDVSWKHHDAPAPRHQASFKKALERTQVFAGEEDNSKSRFVTTHAALGADGAFATRKRNPRYVHGGAFRNAAVEGLPGGRQPQEAEGINMSPTAGGIRATTTGATYQEPGETRHRPTHRFDMPQKNISTFMHASLAVPADDLYHDTRKPFATHTDHRRPSSAYKAYYTRQEPTNGASHFTSDNRARYMPRWEGLVVPPGKVRPRLAPPSAVTAVAESSPPLRGPPWLELQRHASTPPAPPHCIVPSTAVSRAPMLSLAVRSLAGARSCPLLSSLHSSHLRTAPLSLSAEPRAWPHLGRVATT